ncbi:MAG: S-adenosylmethionine:tRNA ribosyltransferase-isomerase [Acidimicrobiales bacterium]
MTSTTRLGFELPSALEAREPPEARGDARDGVRMMATFRSSGALVHSRFCELPDFLSPGDLVVINTSATIPAEVDAESVSGRRFFVHFSTEIEDDLWVVEPRMREGKRSSEWTEAQSPPGTFFLADGGTIELLEHFPESRRLFLARVSLPLPARAWLERRGRPIHYGYLDRDWPLAAYQSAFASTPGSATMPSAGRPLSPEVITRLVGKGVGVTPVVLHTGVASLDSDELPYPERAVVPKVTANRVNATRFEGGRVIAVGTTVVRALESAVGEFGCVEEFCDWTNVLITPERGVRVIDGIVTGWHEPEASHLLMLEAIAGRDLLERAYDEAIREGYLFHEFGDSHLVLP